MWSSRCRRRYAGFYLREPRKYISRDNFFRLSEFALSSSPSDEIKEKPRAALSSTSILSTPLYLRNVFALYIYCAYFTTHFIREFSSRFPIRTSKSIIFLSFFFCLIPFSLFDQLYYSHALVFYESAYVEDKCYVCVSSVNLLIYVSDDVS